MNYFTGKFARDLHKMPQHIILTNSNELIRISPERIAYISSDGNYSSMVLTDGDKHIFSFNLSTFEKIIVEQLDNRGHALMRLGKQLIINEKYIYYININKQQLTLSDTSFTIKFTLKASKKALRLLKTTLEKSMRQPQITQ